VRVAGEPLHPDLLRRIMAAIPQAAFVNIYGATEAPTMLWFEVPRPLPEGMEAVPLGRPSSNFEVRLCNDEGEAVAPGEIGEICAVGGPLMLGYWGDPALTANDLQALAQQLRAANVGGTGGHFFYDDRQLPALPEVSDGQPIATPYNAGLGALNVDFNRVDVTWSTVSGEPPSKRSVALVMNSSRGPVSGWTRFT